MRDAATHARTRKKHDTKTQLKNKLTSQWRTQPTAKQKGPDTQQASDPFLFPNHATRLLGVLPISRLHWTKTTLDFLPVLKHGDSYAACLDEGVRFGGFPFRGQVRFIGCRQCSSYLVSTGV